MHKPYIPLKELTDIINKSQKVEKIITVGNTTAFLIKGKKPINSRLTSIKNDDIGVPYEKAMGIAILYKVIIPLSEWFESNKNFKEVSIFYNLPTTLSIWFVAFSAINYIHC